MEKSNQVQQDNGNLSIYERVRSAPKEAKKEIEAGRLKGKHDINPMWRIKALVEQLEIFWLINIQGGIAPDDIKIAMGEADTLVSPTRDVMALWKNTKPTMKFNAKSFQQDDPASYAKYMEPTASTRRFTVK